jgi:hypothetical protein
MVNENWVYSWVCFVRIRRFKGLDRVMWPITALSLNEVT